MKQIIVFFTIVMLFTSCNTNKDKEISATEFKQLYMSDSILSINVNNGEIAKIITKSTNQKDKERYLKIESKQAFTDTLNIYENTGRKNGINGPKSIGYVMGDFSLFSIIPIFSTLFSLCFFILFLYAIIDLLKKKFDSDVNKLMWVLIVIFVPVIGAILYIFIGKKQK